MLARAFRRILLLELAFYAALGWSLVHFAAWSTLQAAAFALSWAVGVRALLIATTFAVAARYASPTPPVYRLGPGAWLTLYLA